MDPEHLVAEFTLERFREDNAYVWQTRVSNLIQYLISTLYVKDNDPLGLFAKLREDGRFGAYVYEYGERAVSRHMLDSILEIGFLEKQVGLSTLPALTVLDIGAGYGRLAHRMAESLPNLARYLCADAEVTAASLDEVERVVGRARIDVALNIHSFSECSLSSIEYWLDLVARAEVPRLFIVPNTGDQLVSWEPDQSRRNFLPAIEAGGYELVVQREKYHRSKDAQRFALFPSTYFLFRRVNR